MKKKEVWMPHSGHLIVGNDCRFHMNTYCNGYIISTVGEYFPDSGIREMFAEMRGVKLEGKGDARDADYLKKLGFEDLGCGRKYETMVFRGIKSKDPCCPYKMASGADLDFAGYNSPEDAFKGHYKMLRKWSRKK